ncbi:DUF3551 domain-containing protein [Bradyrhizobium sp. Ash2021]|uniref:DUF3551 domain-containing protein n=1 Tax=Bradyrhizobium sp. Ash2021 TaxID=2954771 RepID=UPI0028155A9B|nr:DUF3551 domain-containing protein [Bradyrhizobium sp. Ash2021]WMT73528.1 DUF3551 domain-containing protein [Bradyrhizobium sp. Ash2021]
MRPLFIGLAAASIAIAGFAITTSAKAYPFCLVEETEPWCGYATLEQCRASASGRAAFCVANPATVAAVPFRESYRGAIMKHAARVSKNVAFFMRGSERYSAPGVPDPLNDIHQE